MVENTEVKILIYVNTYSLISEYLFTIDTAGFEFSYHKAFIDSSIYPELSESLYKSIKKDQERLKAIINKTELELSAEDSMMLMYGDLTQE